MIWGIVGAVEGEVWPIVDNMSQARESRWNGQPIFQGKIESHDVVVMPTGVGKVRAAASIQFLLDRFPVEAVVFTGAAGGLNPELKIGDIVIGQKSIQHDFDAGGKGILEEMKTPSLEADPGLVKWAVSASRDLGLGDRVRIGTILTGDQTIIDQQKREWLWQTFRGDAVEMEGAAAALVCAQNQVPFVLIRAITDHADKNAREDFRSNRGQAAVDSSRVVLTMLGKTAGIRRYRRHLLFRIRRFLSRKAWALASRLRFVRAPVGARW